MRYAYVMHALLVAHASLTVSAPTYHVAHASLTVSAPMPNRVAHASTCVWPNLTKHKTNPMCLHLPTIWRTQA